MFVLFNFIFAAIAAGVDNLLGFTIHAVNENFFYHFGPIHIIYVLLVIIPSIAVTVRRLHDSGRSGAWIFIFVIPAIAITIYYTFFDPYSFSDPFMPNWQYIFPVATAIGYIWILVLMLLKGDEGLNLYGPKPE